MTHHQKSITTTLADLPDPDPRVLQLLDVWKDTRRGSIIPRKRNFDPLTVPRLLSFMWLYRYDADQSDFICRLAGEDVNKTWGQSIAGKSAREILGDRDHGTITDIWRKVIDTPLINYGKGERLYQNRMYSAERLVLPLAGDDREDGISDHILGISLYGLNDLSEAQPQLLMRNAYQVLCSEIP